MSADWDKIAAQLDALAQKRGYAPVDEVLKKAGSIPFRSIKPNQNRPPVVGRKAACQLRPVAAIMAEELHLWWTNEQ